MWRITLSFLVLLSVALISTDVRAQGSGRCRRGPSSTANIRKVPGGLPLPAHYSRSRNPIQNTGLVATPFISSTALLNRATHSQGSVSQDSAWDAAPVAAHYWNQSMVALPEWLAARTEKSSSQSASANRPSTAVPQPPPQPPMAAAEQFRMLPLHYSEDQVGAAMDDYLFSTAAE